LNRLPRVGDASTFARIQTLEGEAMQASREERFIRLPEVVRRCGVAKSSIWLWARQGRFPSPIRVGPRVTVWRESEVAAWIEAKAAEGRGGAK